MGRKGYCRGGGASGGSLTGQRGSDDVPALNVGFVALIEELEAAASLTQTIPGGLSTAVPPPHGLQRVKDGFDIEEVVAEYNILRGCVHDLAERNGLSLAGEAVPHPQPRPRRGDRVGRAVVRHPAGARGPPPPGGVPGVRGPRPPHPAERHLPVRPGARTAPARERAEAPQAAQMFKALNRNVQHLEVLVGKVLEENTNLETEVGRQAGAPGVRPVAAGRGPRFTTSTPSPGRRPPA